MTVHPRVQKMLDSVPAGAADAFSRGTPDEARATAETFMSSAPRQDVHAVEDRTIPGPSGDLAIRVYRPSDTMGLPVVVFFHGSGFVICSLETHDAMCRAITNASACVVVSVDYRLAPEHPYPAAVEDCWAATRWVADHAGLLSVDANRLAVCGDSAGGNLAAVTALVARDRGGPAIALQILLYPVIDARMNSTSWSEKGDGTYLLSRSGMRWFWHHYLADPSDGEQAYASPIRADDLSNLPPAYIVTAEYDPLCDEGEAYADHLRESGVPVTFRQYDGMLHAFLEEQRGYEVAAEGTADLGALLRDHLHPER